MTLIQTVSHFCPVQDFMDLAEVTEFIGTRAVASSQQCGSQSCQIKSGAAASDVANPTGLGMTSLVVATKQCDTQSNGFESDVAAIYSDGTNSTGTATLRRRH